MELSVRLQAFEGPLDLLLHLIDKNKVSIYDIPIASITDQYMEYVRAMQDEDLDVMSDFLLMAATLLDIKARMLLPKPEHRLGKIEIAAVCHTADIMADAALIDRLRPWGRATG